MARPTVRAADTALISATRVGDIESVRAALKSGVEIDALDFNGASAVVVAAARYRHERNEKFLEIAKLLVRSGANIDIEGDRDRGAYIDDATKSILVAEKRLTKDDEYEARGAESTAPATSAAPLSAPGGGLLSRLFGGGGKGK